IHNSATLKIQPTNNPIYKAHLQNIKAQTNKLKKTTRINKPLQLTHLNPKQYQKNKKFKRKKKNKTHQFFYNI
ncbi:hypothetical protein J8801_24865, partial [Klebsiella pneumoniae]